MFEVLQKLFPERSKEEIKVTTKEPIDMKLAFHAIKEKLEELKFTCPTDSRLTIKPQINTQTGDLDFSIVMNNYTTRVDRNTGYASNVTINNDNRGGSLFVGLEHMKAIRDYLNSLDL